MPKVDCKSVKKWFDLKKENCLLYLLRVRNKL